MSTQHRIFGTAGMCLHCLVWDAINKHSPSWPDEPSMRVYDSEYIVSSLLQVIAQCIAGQPERSTRRKFIAEVERKLPAMIREAIDSGEYPGAKAVTTQ